jgi:hypothetical protein
MKKSAQIILAAGAAFYFLSGKKKDKKRPPVDDELTRPDPDPAPDEPTPDEDEDPLKDYVEDLFKFKCKRMLYNGYCIETLEGAPSAWYAAWSLKIRDADGVKVYSIPASFDSEAEALDHAYSKINGWA